MLLNVSYNNPEIRKKIDNEVGKPFSFFERIKQGGIGLGHLIITSSSIEIQNLLALDKYRNKCNIEFTSDGWILVCFYNKRKLRRFNEIFGWK